MFQLTKTMIHSLFAYSMIIIFMTKAMEEEIPLNPLVNPVPGQSMESQDKQVPKYQTLLGPQEPPKRWGCCEFCKDCIEKGSIKTGINRACIEQKKYIFCCNTVYPEHMNSYKRKKSRLGGWIKVVCCPICMGLYGAMLIPDPTIPVIDKVCGTLLMGGTGDIIAPCATLLPCCDRCACGDPEYPQWQILYEDNEKTKAYKRLNQEQLKKDYYKKQAIRYERLQPFSRTTSDKARKLV